MPQKYSSNFYVQMNFLETVSKCRFWASGAEVGPTKLLMLQDQDHTLRAAGLRPTATWCPILELQVLKRIALRANILQGAAMAARVATCYPAWYSLVWFYKGEKRSSKALSN